MDIQKQEIREAIELPLIQQDLYAQIGIDPPSGVLLYGPPGRMDLVLEIVEPGDKLDLVLEIVELSSCLTTHPAVVHKYNVLSSCLTTTQIQCEHIPL